MLVDRWASASTVVPARQRRSRRAASAAAQAVAQAVATLLLLLTYFGARAYLHGRAVDLLLSAEYHGREPLCSRGIPLIKRSC